jgi:holin-like protein
MLRSLLLLFLCQVSGEVIQHLSYAPIPGPVIGMGLLLAGLLIWGEVPTELNSLGSGLLGYLQVLFVPAGVGVMAKADLLRAEWLPITIALVGSSVVAIAISAFAMQLFGERLRRNADEAPARQKNAENIP